jgi:uncharacterized protein
VYLLDGNVLVALADQAHVHHEIVLRWFVAGKVRFATCPFTQGTLIRMLVRFQAVASVKEAVMFLKKFSEHPAHSFWPDTLSYEVISWRGVLGQRQVTDAYLVALALHNGGRLATLDQGLAALHANEAVLLA